MADRTKLGEAYVAITADGAALDASLREAEAAVTEFADTAQQEADKAGEAIEGVGGSATEAATEIEQATDRAGTALEEMGDKAEASGKKVTESTKQATESVDGLSDATETVGTESESAGKKVDAGLGGSLQRLQSSITKQVGVLTGLVGAFVAVAGAATVFYNIGERISRLVFNQGKAFTTTKEDIAKYSEELGVAANSADRYRRTIAQGMHSGLLEELQKVEEKLAKVDQTRERNTRFTQVQAQTEQNILRAQRDRITEILNAEERLLRAIERRDQRQAALLAADTERAAAIQAIIDEQVAAQSVLERAGLSRAEAIKAADEDLYARLAELSENATQADLANIELAKQARMERSALELRLIAEEEQARARASQAQREQMEADMAVRLREEAERLRREELEPVQRRILELEDRSQELIGQLAEASSPELRTEILRLIGEVVGRIDALRDEAKQSAANTEGAVAEGVRRGLETIRNDITRIANDIRVTAQGVQGLS